MTPADTGRREIRSPPLKPMREVAIVVAELIGVAAPGKTIVTRRRVGALLEALRAPGGGGGGGGDGGGGGSGNDGGGACVCAAVDGKQTRGPHLACITDRS